MELEKMKLYELYHLLLIDIIHRDKDISNLDIDKLFKLVNEKYKEENGVYLDKKSELYKWLSDKSRYILLDDLLVRLFARFINIEMIKNIEIDNTDIFFVNNINEMKRIMDEEGEIISNIEIVKCDNKTKIDKDNVIEIVKDILIKLDNNGEWLDIYNNAIRDKKIIYLNELSKEELDKFKEDNDINQDLNKYRNVCCFNTNGSMYIILTYTGNISDISSTIHEVIHYISRCYNNKNEKLILRELPSIFYEIYTLNYLNELGYSKKEIDEIKLNRYTDTYEAILDIDILMNYFIILLSKGNITKDDVIDEYRICMRNIYGNDNYYEIPNEYDSRCDDVIHDLIKNQYMLFKSYPYIIGSYLASMAINKLDSDMMIMSFMKYITEHIDSVCEEDVFNIILDGKIDLYYDDEDKVKVREK